MARKDLIDRFLALTAPGTSSFGGVRCVEWTGTDNGQGYGGFGLVVAGKKKQVYAHRWSYEHWVGPIPEGLELDHLCRNRRCVHPAHLEPVTHAENMRRGDTPIGGRWQRARTHCPRGHPYDEENTYAYQGRRHCRECRKWKRRKGVR